MIPFVIIGHPRSGSTLLKEAIAQHDDLKIYGELFHKVANERMNTHYVNRTENSCVYYEGGDQDALQFLNKHVWGEDSYRYKAVGFKLFAERVQCPGSDNLFALLKNEIPNLHIIHIIRENYLDMWVSRKKAEQSGVWRIPVNGHRAQVNRELSPVNVNPDDLLIIFDQMDKATNFFKRYFNDIDHIQISYTSLVDSFQKNMDTVFNFLNVEPIISKMTIKKQNNAPHREFINNYDELKTFFSNTKYSKLFIDN